MDFTVTFRGREVTRQPWRALVVLVSIPAAVLGLLVLTPLLLLAHPVLRLFGFRGTYVRTPTSLAVTWKGALGRG